MNAFLLGLLLDNHGLLLRRGIHRRESPTDGSETRVVNSIEPAILCRVATAEATINEIGGRLDARNENAQLPKLAVIDLVRVFRIET